MTAREDIATAASAVEGIDALPYFGGDLDPGDAFVRLDRIEYPNRFGGIAYWDLVVALPQDLTEAEQYVEAVVPDLVQAVSPQLAVDRVSPQRLDITGVGVVPVVFISGHREE